MFHKHPQKSGQLVEHKSVISFSQLLIGTPQGCSLPLGSCALHNSKGPRSHLFSGIGQCGGPVSCHLHFHLMSLLSGRKKELEYLGLCIFFFFPTKGLLPVSELWLLPPKLSLQLQCTDGLRMRVFVCAHLCMYFKYPILGSLMHCVCARVQARYLLKCSSFKYSQCWKM